MNATKCLSTAAMMILPMTACAADAQLSCSSPAVIETARAITLLKSNGEVAEITNTGPLGMTGNVLVCSGDWTARSYRNSRGERITLDKPALSQRRTYTIQPLDDGRFRVSIQLGIRTVDGTEMTLDGIGPASYADALRRDEERGEKERVKHEEMKKAACINRRWKTNREIEECLKQCHPMLEECPRTMMIFEPRPA